MDNQFKIITAPQKIIILVLLLFGHNGFAKDFKKLPEWWDNTVYQASGDLKIMHAVFPGYNDQLDDVFSYEISLLRESNYRGSIEAHRFISKSKIGKAYKDYRLELQDGFVKLYNNDTTIWYGYTLYNDQLIIDHKVLYEIDLIEGQTMDSRFKDVSKLSVDVKRVNKVKTFFIKNGYDNLTIKEYEDRLKFSYKGEQGRLSSMTLFPQNRPYSPFKSINKTSNSDVTSIFNEAHRLFENKEYNKSLELLNKSIAQDKTFTLAWLTRGIVYQALEKYKEARENYDFYLQRESPTALVLLYKGFTQYKLANYTSALYSLKRSIELENNNGLAYYYAGLSVQAVDKSSPEQCIYFQKAKQLDPEKYGSLFTDQCGYDEEKLKGMINNYKQAPVSGDKILLEALGYAQLHKELFEAEKQAVPFDINLIRLLLARFYLTEENKQNLAIITYVHLLDEVTDQDLKSIIHYEIALAYLEVDNRQEAINSFTTVVDQHRGENWKDHEKLSLYHLIKIYDDELNDYTKALQYASILADVKMKYGSHGYSHLDRNTMTIVDAYQVNEGDNLMLTGFDLEDTKNYNYTANKNDKNRASFWPLERKASFLLSLRKNQLALEEYNKLIKLNPDKKTIYSGYLGNVYFNLKQYENSIKHLDYALENNIADSGGALEFLLGISYAKTGEKDKGCGLLEKSKEKDYDRAQLALYDYCYDVNSWTWHMRSGIGSFNSDIYVHKGDLVEIEASGKIKFGSWVGSAGPDGFTNGAYTMYNQVRGSNHGALLCRIGAEGDWYIVGREFSFTAKKDGYLRLLINDRDPSNNYGEFEGKIRVYSK